MFFIYKISSYKVNERFTYGYIRAYLLGAFANTVFLISSFFFITLESVHKFTELSSGEPLVSNIPQNIIVGILGLVVNIIGLLVI